MICCTMIYLVYMIQKEQLDEDISRSSLIALLTQLSATDYKRAKSALESHILYTQSDLEAKLKGEKLKNLEAKANRKRNVALLCAIPIFSAPFALPVAGYFEYRRQIYEKKVSDVKNERKERRSGFRRQFSNVKEVKKERKERKERRSSFSASSPYYPGDALPSSLDFYALDASRGEALLRRDDPFPTSSSF